MREFESKLTSFVTKIAKCRGIGFFAIRQPYYTYSIANRLLKQLSELHHELGQEHKCCRWQLLYPNQYIQSFFNKPAICGETRSIYSFLYGVPKYTKEGQKVYPLRGEFPAEMGDKGINPIIFIMPFAHLLSNNKFETDEVLYGSGFLLNDFLAFLNKHYFGKQAVIIIAIGDPFQILRGNEEGSLLMGKFFEKEVPECHCDYWEGSIDKKPKELSPDSFKFQRPLLQQLKAGKYAYLPACCGIIEERKRGESTEQILADISAWPKNAIYLCAERSKAQQVNQWVRKKHFRDTGSHGLNIGDIVLLRNIPIEIKKTQSDYENIDKIELVSPDGAQEFYGGGFAKILNIESRSSIKSRQLKGRDKPITIEFAYAEIEYSCGSVRWVCYLPEYLNSDKGELPADYGLVLHIWAQQKAETEENVRIAKENYDNAVNALKKIASESKEEKDNQIAKANKANIQLLKQKYEEERGRAIACSIYKNVAYLRYGYAETVHKMQSLGNLDTIFLSAEKSHDTDNPATESYFRWLYTASLCAKKSLILLNYPHLTPFSKTEFIFAECEIKPINARQRIYYNYNETGEFENEDLLYLRGLSPNLLGLCRTVSAHLADGGWELRDIVHSAYKERYIVSKSALSGEVEFNYNNKGEVYLGKIDGAQGVRELQSQLQTQPIFQEENVKFAAEFFAQTLQKTAWAGFIIAYEEKPYKLFLTLDSPDGKLKLEFNIPSDGKSGKKGIISSVKLLAAESQKSADIFISKFKSIKEAASSAFEVG